MRLLRRHMNTLIILVLATLATGAFMYFVGQTSQCDPSIRNCAVQSVTPGK